MNAVIVGGGKVGGELARTLVNDGHSVSVIDNSPKALENISDELDVITYLGSGVDMSLLMEAGVKSANIFIAVTTSDEVNLLSCLMARSVSNCEAISRVRNPVYSKETEFLKKRLGLSLIINPERLAAREIYSLLQYPALKRLDFLDDGSIAVATLRIPEHFKYVGRSLQDIMKADERLRLLICAVVRDGEVTIPRGDFIIQAGDEITVVTARDDLRRFIKSSHIQHRSSENILIVGTGIISFYLTHDLLRRGRRVRLIENDLEKCHLFSEQFPEAEIIHGDGTDRNFLLRHGLLTADAFVPLTGVDEENLIIANYAKTVSKAKVITKLNRTDLSDLIRTLDLDTVVFPKMLCADIIIQYAKAMQAGARGNVATLYRYLDDSIEIMEFISADELGITGVPLKELKLKKNLILAGIVRNGAYEVPSGNSTIEVGDHVVVVTSGVRLNSLYDVLIK